MASSWTPDPARCLEVGGVYAWSLRELGGEWPVAFGLIAEEVAELCPQLVGYDEDGRPFSVRYPLFVPLLLEQLQLQGRELAKLQVEVVELRRLLAERSASSS